jgi:hypothetical protein
MAIDKELADELRSLRLAIESAAIAQQRDMLAVERRLSSIEDAVAGWVEHYWHHTDHPPRPA